MLFEKCAKGLRMFKTQFISDLCNRKTGDRQPLFRVFNDFILDVLTRILAGR